MNIDDTLALRQQLTALRAEAERIAQAALQYSIAAIKDPGSTPPAVLQSLDLIRATLDGVQFSTLRAIYDTQNIERALRAGEPTGLPTNTGILAAVAADPGLQTFILGGLAEGNLVWASVQAHDVHEATRLGAHAAWRYNTQNRVYDATKVTISLVSVTNEAGETYDPEY